jgi:predicted Zn-dependent protease
VPADPRILDSLRDPSKPPLLVKQVLLIRSSETSLELGASLWAAMEEAGAFYNSGGRPCLRIDREYLSSQVPAEMTAAAAGDPARYSTWESTSNVWFLSRGRFARTYRHEALISAVRELVGDADQVGRLLIVTDQELMPPKDWHYVIWRGGEGRADAVVSIAPLDPVYWNEPDEDRRSTVKQRARSALLCILGGWLGLERCDNEKCFLFGNVDSVNRLDIMIKLGPEHELSGLTGRGFKAQTPMTEVIQRADDSPTSRAPWVRYEA